ncbi:MFS transporter [Piscinibacter sp.]|uniref:MFS transporter n=1 Tax=Piscinibacter sp. TaxID=1903157 RepID=UPI002D117559|nr:MFS transporter [Albitalea sp.]HUG24343.1 MFS transporter [Albitalea sp.]
MSSIPVSADSARTLSHAAWGVRAQFFVAGGLFATWGVHVPTVKAHFRLDESALALAMLAAGVGALLALLQAGRLVGRHGPRGVVLATGLACAVCIAALVAFDVYVALIGLMLVYGMASSLFDVAINAEASEIERRSGRALMSGFHGMFSLGGMAGAAAGGALLAAGVGPQQHLLGAALFGLVVIGAGSAAMLRMEATTAAGLPLSLPRGALALIGLLAALGLIAEGAMYDWSVLYIRQELHSDAGTAALGYASFSAAMAAARFGGDWVRARLASVLLLRLSGALGAAGMALALLVPHPIVALIGFALVGLGFANVVPVLFSAAARVPGVTPAHGIAAVSSLGYLGMMAGPPLIGLIAQAQSLTLGLFTIVLAAVILSLSAKRALP